MPQKYQTECHKNTKRLAEFKSNQYHCRYLCKFCIALNFNKILKLENDNNLSFYSLNRIFFTICIIHSNSQ